MKSRLRAVLVILVLSAGIASAAEVFIEQYRSLDTAPAVALSVPVSSADSVTLDTPVRPRSTHGDPRVIIAPTFSVQGASACLEVVLYQRVPGTSTTTFATIAVVQTITGQSTTLFTSRSPSVDGYVIAPTLGCQVYDVRVRSISSGNVTWSSWSVGPSSIPAGTASE